MFIKIDKVRKSFGKKEVLKDVSFEAKMGQCIGLLGENGSGKSTMFSVLTGLQKGEGSFIFNDEDLMKNTALRSKVLGFVPQVPPLMAELTAKDNLSLWYEKNALEKELEEGVLNLLGIPAFYKTPVHRMSGGMKKRLSIGCAVAHKPRVLFLDEPSAALDLVCKEKISQYLMDYKKHGGIIVIATHDVYELEFCDELHLLKNGILTPYKDERDIHNLVECLQSD